MLPCKDWWSGFGTHALNTGLLGSLWSTCIYSYQYICLHFDRADGIYLEIENMKTMLVLCTYWSRVSEKPVLYLKNSLMLVRGCELQIHKEDSAASLCFQFVCILTLWKYNNNLAWPKPMRSCSFCPDLSHSGSTESPMWPVSIASCSPCPSWGRQHCPNFVGSIPKRYKQKKIQWHLKEILSNRMLRNWQVRLLLADNK